MRIHSIVLNTNGNSVTYSNSFGVEHIPKKNKRFIDNKNIITNSFIMKFYDSIISGYFCIGCILFSMTRVLQILRMYDQTQKNQGDRRFFHY